MLYFGSIIGDSMLLKSPKKWMAALVLTGILAGSMLLSFTEKMTPAEHTRALCMQDIKAFQAQLDTFQQLSEQQAAKEVLIGRFKQSRIAFKRFEYMLEYMDNRRHPFFNGANAIEMDDGYNPNAKPEGLQVIEAELTEDSLNYEQITFLTKQLKYRALSFYLLLKDATLKDAFIFEAIRFHLIRMETLSLVSFDSPDFRNNTAEMKTTLQLFKKLLDFYKKDNNTTEIAKFSASLQAASAYLNNKNFLTLDRLFFIKNHLQVLTKDLFALQQKLQISYLEDSYSLFRVVNLRTQTIYDTNFINPKFYASDKYYPTHPLYTELGKKLFFDTRLSSDNSMSCATCHNPNLAFTDKMSTAITNKPGEFQKRNTPTLLHAAFQAAYFYDFSAVTLETQVNQVVSNPHEFNTNYDTILSRLQADTQYVRMFTAAFPQYGEHAVSISGITLCLADFQRQLVSNNTAFDRYMRGQTNYIDPAVKRGFNLFMGKGQCGTCHFAPTFFGTVPPFYGVSESEVLGVPKVYDTLRPVMDDDIGRFKNFEVDFFKFSFKTSTVRNAALTAPYMHNGVLKTLEEVVDFYNRGGGAGMGLDIPNQTLVSDRLHLTTQEQKDIVAFMKALTDTSSISRLFPK